MGVIAKTQDAVNLVGVDRAFKQMPDSVSIGITHDDLAKAYAQDIPLEGLILYATPDKSWLDANLHGWREDFTYAEGSAVVIRSGRLIPGTSCRQREMTWEEAKVFISLFGIDNVMTLSAGLLAFETQKTQKDKRYSTPSGDTYHLTSCYIVSGRDDLIEYADEAEAESAGKTPCSICNKG